MHEPSHQSAGGDAAHPARRAINAAGEQGEAEEPETADARAASSRSAETRAAATAHGDARERLRQQRWSLVSAVCLMVAVPCLLMNQVSAAFVVATLGVVAWFLNVRNQLRRACPEASDDFDDDEGEYEREPDGN